MTKKVALFIENGSEELEFIAPLDVMRRGGLHVDLISANEEYQVTSSHGVKITADKKISEIKNILEYDAIVVPGGLPGAEYLKNNNKLIEFFKTMYSNKKLVAAICAAPIVLNEAGITKNKNITCYPGFEKNIDYKNYSSTKAVVLDENVITSQGPAVALLFGLEILKYLLGEEASNNVAKPMLIDVLKNNL
ncbi:DJ-1 family glyoxalase III [Gemella sp. zg-1178]|uniref:DJ-1 family glyoxalase III n=1 Tax=Gemella sp. zg-1178 TaxID=2840372 RepID=UPI001C041194|nr:DJ-1 family glyoxalase III [Gemella sp. zg-1178]MBU0278881.1 DJ-1/PfpI family protein [Gemella sp. zg-1178]